MQCKIASKDDSLSEVQTVSIYFETVKDAVPAMSSPIRRMAW